MLTLKMFFLSTDELMSLQHPLFGEVVKMFQEVIIKLHKIEPSLDRLIILAFDRLLSKFKDNSHMVNPNEFECIFNVYMTIFQTHIEASRARIDQKMFGVLSEDKLDIIECIDSHKQVDMMNSLKAVEDLTIYSNGLCCLMDSKITYAHTTLISARLAPFIRRFVDDAMRFLDNYEYLVHVFHLTSVALKTRKVNIYLPTFTVNRIYTALLDHMLKSSRLGITKWHSSLYITFVNIKKYFQVTVHNRSTTVLVTGLREEPPLITLEIFNLMQKLTQSMFKDIFRNPINISTDSQYVELFYVLFDALIELAGYYKKSMRDKFLSITEGLRRQMKDITTDLDEVVKDGPIGKISEEVLLMVWKINDMINI